MEISSFYRIENNNQNDERFGTMGLEYNNN